MIGFIVGTLCLIGFIAVWRRRFGRGWYGYGCGFERGYGAGWHSGRRRFGLYRVFSELDTSPGQEKAIRSALGELRAAASALRPELSEARRALASSLAAESFDPGALERTLGGRLAEAAGLWSALIAALAKVHEALDPDQRKRLSRLVGELPSGAPF